MPVNYNLYILEIEESQLPKNFWELPLGSEPKKSYETVEGLVVPNGKVWLFPIGGGFDRLETALGFKGKRIIKKITI